MKAQESESLQLAKQIWDTLDANERFGCKFGRFPAEKMQPADKPGCDHHRIVVALMDMATAGAA
jgi:hypothetical protein